MTKPKPDQPEQTTVQWMADELRKAKSREKKLEAALHEVFPLDLYIQMRPDVKEAYHGEAKQTIEHFIRKGINETDFKEEREKNNYRQRHKTRRGVGVPKIQKKIEKIIIHKKKSGNLFREAGK